MPTETFFATSIRNFSFASVTGRATVSFFEKENFPSKYSYCSTGLNGPPSGPVTIHISSISVHVPDCFTLPMRRLWLISPLRVRLFTLPFPEILCLALPLSHNLPCSCYQGLYDCQSESPHQIYCIQMPAVSAPLFCHCQGFRV